MKKFFSGLIIISLLSMGCIYIGHLVTKNYNTPRTLIEGKLCAYYPAYRWGDHDQSLQLIEGKLCIVRHEPNGNKLVKRIEGPKVCP